MPMLTALELVQSPDSAAPDSLAGVLITLDSLESDLLLVAAAIYTCPECLPPELPKRLAAVLIDPALTPRRLDLVREVLQFLLTTPLAAETMKQVLTVAAASGLSPDIHAALCQILECAAEWNVTLLGLPTLVALAETAQFAAHRLRLCERVIEPAVHAAPAEISVPLLERVGRLYGEDRGYLYLLYAISGWRQFAAPVREWAALQLRGRFPWHAIAAERLGGEGRRVLLVHNINDGQGDEIVRWAALAQAFLDFNPHLEVVLVTHRVYLGAHPRLRVVAIEDHPAVQGLLKERFDAVIDFYEQNVVEVNYDREMESRVQNLVRDERPFLFASSTKGFNRVVFDQLEMDGREVGESSGLNHQRVENIYETTARLIAEMGMPLRCGEDPPRGPLVLAGVEWPEARAAWQTLLAGNRGGRPVAIFNPFGGREKIKGFVESTFQTAAAEIERLIAHGYFVVLFPNGTPWGAADDIRKLADRVSPELRDHIAIAPNPAERAKSNGEKGHIQAGNQADLVMRQLIYFASFADFIVTVEGWLMHIAWSLGRPYAVLMAPLSHPQKWHPYLRTERQGIEAQPASPAGKLSEPDPLLSEQPRKFVLLFLLRELEAAGDPAVLPLLRKAAKSPDRHIRQAAAAALAKIPGTEVVGDLEALLADSWGAVRAAAASGLLNRSATVSVPAPELLGYVYASDSGENWPSLSGLGEAALPALAAATQDDDEVIRREAAHAKLMLDFRLDVRRRLYRREAASTSPLKLLRTLLGWKRRPAPRAVRPGTVLILTPVKDALPYLRGYAEQLRKLTFSHGAISLGFLESDSGDGTFEALSRQVKSLRREFRRAHLWKKDFGYRLPPGVHRGAAPVQAQRRAMLARSRNHLLVHALDDEEWVLWLDVDVVEYPADIIQRLLATDKEIVQPHCVLDYRGATFDKNAWRDRGRLHLDDLRSEGDLVELDAVGGTMLLVRADIHRDGLVFPAYPYGLRNSRIRSDAGELETEGLGMMARDMGYRCWGMPNLEIRHGRW